MKTNLDAPCLSAVVSGMRDEGGKGGPNKIPSVAVASVTIQDLSAMCGEVRHAAYEQPFRSPPQGESLLEPDPGLKPWAILLCHFVAFGNPPGARISSFALSPFRPFAHSPFPPCTLREFAT
jgi:hypothetical protein